MRVNWKNVGKALAGGLFVLNTAVQAAQGWNDPAYGLPPQARFWLFIVASAIGAALVVLPRLGERHDVLPRG